MLELREDEPRPEESTELFSDLLREASTFKFNVTEVHDLHEKVEYFEWKDQVRGVCLGGRSSLSLAQWKALLETCDKRNYRTRGGEEGKMIDSWNAKVIFFRKRVAELSGKKAERGIPFDNLRQLHSDGLSLNVAMDEIEDVATKVAEVEAWCARVLRLVELEADEQQASAIDVEDFY